MSWILLASAAVALLLAFLWWWGGRPVIHRNVKTEDLSRFVEGLVCQMGPGSVMLAENEDQEGFLQLAVRNTHGDWRTIELGLPDLPWSINALERVVRSVEDMGLSAEVERGRGKVDRFLRVSVSGEEHAVTSRASELLTAVADALGWSNCTFRVHYEGTLDYRLAVGAVRRKAARGA